MVKDAEEHAEEDKKRRELVEAKNQGEALIHTTERTLSETGDKVGAEYRQPVEEAIEALKSEIQGDDGAAIKAKTEALAQVAMKLGEQLYQAGDAGGPGDDDAGPGAGPGADAGTDAGAGSSSGGDENVVDADFEEVDDDQEQEPGAPHRNPPPRQRARG